MQLISNEQFAQLFESLVNGLVSHTAAGTKIPLSLGILLVDPPGYKIDTGIINPSQVTVEQKALGAFYGSERRIVCAAFWVEPKTDHIKVVGNIMNHPSIVQTLRIERDENDVITGLTKTDAANNPEERPLDTFWAAYSVARLASSPDPFMRSRLRAFAQRN